MFPKCGYSAITKFYGFLSPHQIKLIKTEISREFKGIDDSKETLTYDDAILRHKLSLACCIVKSSKYSERAYTCLKLAWLIRGKRENLPEDAKEIEQLKKRRVRVYQKRIRGICRSI